MGETRLSFVSVVFEAELALLELQARSMARFVPADLAREIVLIDNTARGLPAAARTRLLEQYGHLAPAVRVLRPDDIARVPGAIGWRTQQVLKLAVAEQLSGDLYVVLDAKNHFVDVLEAADLVGPDGRPRANAYGYRTHPLRPNLEHVLTYLGLDPAPHVDRFTATVTPFVLDTGLVREMIRDVEARAGRPFAQEFVARELTEFFLYAGWILRSGRRLEDVYSLDLERCPTVWPKAATRAGVEEAVATVVERDAPLFAVHRRALATLDPDAVGALAAFWAERGLFPTADAARAFVAEFQRTYRRTARVQRLRELPYRLRSVPRKVRRVVARRLGRGAAGPGRADAVAERPGA